MQSRNFSIRALALLLTLLLTQPWMLVAQGSSAPQLPAPGRTGMNKQQQEQLGLQAVGEVYKQMPVLPDSSPETQYIQHLGKKLQAVIPADASWPYQFHVIPAADINAFALPGGPIFVNLGTIQAADNEAELAGVLAHEMSHVYMQHSAKQAPKATVAQVIAGLAGAVLPQSGLGNLGRMGIQIGAGTMLMKYSRTDEAQADSVGAIIMYRAGYNPKAMADFFQKLEQKYGKGGPQMLSDHPNPGNRQASIQQEVRNWPAKNYDSNTGEFPRAKQDASKQKAYSAQEIAQGAKSGQWEQQNRKNNVVPANLPSSPSSSNQGGEGNGKAAEGATNVAFKQIKPSANFSKHAGQGFDISYPDNWKVAGDQNTTIIAPAEGAGNNGLSYGVMVGGAQAGGSLDQTTQQLIQTMQHDNPGMRVSGEPADVSVNGVQGRSVILQGNSPLQLNGEPLPERDWLVTVPRPDGSAMYLVFVSPERDFSELHPTFQKMLDSLQLR
ncbi:MAG TPA: M48 family metallopeptidase [Candidatus Angelobacter sp.]|nr:M48 family metallopeptidase [Candidatus Angelobacter sp.]